MLNRILACAGSFKPCDSAATMSEDEKQYLARLDSSSSNVSSSPSPLAALFAPRCAVTSDRHSAPHTLSPAPAICAIVARSGRPRNRAV